MNQRQFVLVLTITFFVGMVWLISDIIFNTKASIPISDKLESLLEPVNPNFDPRVLKDIEETADTNFKRPFISPDSENQGTPEGELSP